MGLAYVPAVPGTGIPFRRTAPVNPRTVSDFVNNKQT